MSNPRIKAKSRKCSEEEIVQLQESFVIFLLIFVCVVISQNWAVVEKRGEGKEEVEKSEESKKMREKICLEKFKTNFFDGDFFSGAARPPVCR